jgi:nucleotide-binding universal stress UspA family protein
MVSSFKNILIPVDLTVNTEVSIYKALELADGDTTIHLLYVENNGVTGLITALKKYLTAPERLIGKTEIKRKMDHWKISIEESSGKIKVRNWIVVNGSVQNTIEKKATQLGIDLIIIGKHGNHSWLPFLNTVLPSMIFKRTGIAVLTVTPGAMAHKLRRVVIPVIGDESIQLKMDMISNLCKKFSLHIHLLTFTNRNSDGTDLNVSSFLQAYQCLKLNSHCHLEYAVLYGDNKAKAILKYAEKVQADVLVVHPGSETKIGWPNKNIADMLPAASRMHVLAV